MLTRLIALAACCLALAFQASAQAPEEARPRIEALVGQLARELAALCPLANPADETALDACRRALFTGSLLRASLDEILLWGRPHSKPGESLKNTTLTQF